ncbi:MAG TPA: hypothetical protein VNN17_11905, partial [Terriglobia bacterium]|nr:hypothetical protein [Terriglobia bacterium]
DAATVAGGAVQAAGTGAIIGVAGNSDRAAGAGYGALIGAGVGATAGMIAVLLTRGNEVQLLRGSALEMQLDRDLVFYGDELDFSASPSPLPLPTPAAAPVTPVRGNQNQRSGEIPLPRPLPGPF